MPSQPPSTLPSSQSSLYQFYSPLPTSSPSTQPRRILQPSTQQNIPLPSPERRIHLKRPHPQKSTATKKAKSSSRERTVDVTQTVPEVLPVRRVARQTVGRSLIARGLGQRSLLQQLTCLEMAKKYYSRPVDLHQIHTENGEATFPFSVECCKTNSLCGISDEQGGVRLLDTSITQETGITKEVISLKCHDNAVFDISWSTDDYKLATASGDQTGKVFDIMSRECIAVFSGYHKTTLKKVEFKPDHNNILSTSSRDGSVFIWDLRCTGLSGNRYKPISSIMGGHPISRKKNGDIALGNAVTGLCWMGDLVVSACDANSIIKIWDPRMLNALSTKSPTAIQSSKPPATHKSRDYGITSITCQDSWIYALSKDSRLYAYSITHLDHGPLATFSHPNLKCDTFWIKLAVKNSLIATGSSDACVILLPSDPTQWRRNPSIQPSNSSIGETSAATSLGGTSGTGNVSRGQCSGVVLRGGHSREVTDVGFTWEDGGVCSIGDDTVVRVWREDDGQDRKRDREEGEGSREMGCGWGWAEW